MNKIISTVIAAVAFSAVSASAETYGFFNITPQYTTPSEAAHATAQIAMEVTNVGVVGPTGHNQVSFLFTNSGPHTLSITDIYFDDGTLLGHSAINQPAGVQYEVIARPPNLPDSAAYNFRPERQDGIETMFSFDSNSPQGPKGVNPGEWVEIVFELLGTTTFTDILNALALAQTNVTQDIPGGLRVGIAVADFPNNGKGSFINGGLQAPNPVPDSSATALLLGVALLGIGVSRRCLA
jgi:hypothetical protein